MRGLYAASLSITVASQMTVLVVLYCLSVSTYIEYGSQIMAAEDERRMENGAGGATFLQFSTV